VSRRKLVTNPDQPGPRRAVRVPATAAEDDLRWLIRQVSAVPGRLEWLRRLIARHIDVVARSLYDAGNDAAAGVASSYAEAMRRGEVTVW
jgi:hypothetical protein